MKIKFVVMMFAFSGFCIAAESKVATDPKIAEIDARLAELTTIWREDTGIINRLTNFKRTPVQEGTQAYYKCLEASKRIQQAEVEAKILKEKRSVVATQSSTEKSADARRVESRSDNDPASPPKNISPVNPPIMKAPKKEAETAKNDLHDPSTDHLRETAPSQNDGQPDYASVDIFGKPRPVTFEELKRRITNGEIGNQEMASYAAAMERTWRISKVIDKYI